MIQNPINVKQDRYLVGCPYCDLLIQAKPLRKGYNLFCPRCDAVLLKSSKDSINRTLALSISGIILFFPACFLPLLKLNILGYSGYCTMLKGVVQMYRNGYWWMTFLVLFCSVLVPFVTLFLLFGISLSAKMEKFPPILKNALKLHHALSKWTMLDVYMIGILIAYIKMKDYGDILAGIGLYCFAGLLCVATLTMLSFDSHLIWNMFERGQ